MSLLEWDCFKVAGEGLDSVNFVLHWICITFPFLKNFARNGNHRVDPRRTNTWYKYFYALRCEKLHNFLFSLNGIATQTMSLEDLSL